MDGWVLGVCVSVRWLGRCVTSGMKGTRCFLPLLLFFFFFEILKNGLHLFIFQILYHTGKFEFIWLLLLRKMHSIIMKQAYALLMVIVASSLVFRSLLWRSRKQPLRPCVLANLDLITGFLEQAHRFFSVH